MAHAFDPGILREYDMRGVVGRTLGLEDAYALGRSFATMLAARGRDSGAALRIAVCRDGRLSSPKLSAALIRGLNDSGADVVDIGIGPSPMLYYAEASAEERGEHLDGGVQVTGSHNPADHNGFKLVAGGRPFFGADIVALGRVAAAGQWIAGSGGHEQRDVLPAYVERLLRRLDRPDQPAIDGRALAALRIGWDAGNGAAGPVVEALTRRLPGEHHLLHTRVDGSFPHHHPDPSVAANLAELRALVAAKRLHFGLAFDGDGDRLGVVDASGRILWGDQLLAILAEDLLRDLPGATVIADVKCSDAVFARIAALGGKPLMWKTGHSLLKAKMIETGAPLAGEFSGHLFFAHDWYGFDDALYAAIRLIVASVRAGRSVTALRDAMPDLISTPDLRFAANETRKMAIVADVARDLSAQGARVDTTDGVRVSTEDGWWLLRASNTQAMLTARAESASVVGLRRLLAMLNGALVAAGVALPDELTTVGAGRSTS